MNYRHSFHAGNIADVFKHASLLLLIKILHEKDAPLTFIDTHGGRGLYDLESIEAGKTQESLAGIHKVADSGEFLLSDYLSLVTAFNPKNTLRYCPGSPIIFAHKAAPKDVVIINEKHPDEANALRTVFHGDKQVHIHERDGYELWEALTPPKTPRGVVFVDPPYEQKNEFERITETLATVHKKWSHGISFIWYPIKNRPVLRYWEETLIATDIPKILQAEHLLYDEAPSDRLNGSGIIVVNPPYKFVQELPMLMESIRRALKPEGHSGSTLVRWLTEEN